MSSPGSDPWLDAQLRNVPLPVGFLARLSEAKSTGDSQPDSAQSDAALSDSGQLDAALVAVPLPEGMLDRLRWIKREPRRRTASRHLALAASLLVALGLSYLGLQGAHWANEYFANKPNDGGPNDGRPNDGREIQPALSLPAPEALADSAGEEESTDAIDDDSLWQEMPPLLAEDVDLTKAIPTDLNQLLPRRRGAGASQIYTANVVFDRLPLIERLDQSLGRGIAPPLTPAYPLAEHLKTGLQQLASPAADKALETSHVPLSTGRGSYELVKRYLEENRLPPPEDVRTEDFLAAIDYAFVPAPPGTLGIRTAAGPSPFGKPGLRLLQIGVQAGQLLPADRAPTRLIVAIDTSASMRLRGRLDAARAGLARLAEQMGPLDHFSLISFSDQADVLVDDAGRENTDQLLAAVESLVPQGGTNFGAGLELACTVARRKPLESGATCRIVLVTDGLSEMSPHSTRQVEAMLAAAADQGLTSHMIDVSHDAQADARLESFAAAGKGRAIRAAGSDQIAYALLEMLTGRSQVVAGGASLSVTFNPASVGAYRLVGHEAITLTGPNNAPLEVDLRAAETATALFELWLNPTGGDDVAVAELTWRDPSSAAGAERHRLTQRISRAQFAKSLAESPVSLQAAAMAAHTAEVLKGPFPAVTPQALATVRQVAAQLHPQLSQRPSFRDLLLLVERADKARVSGSRGRTPAESTRRQ